jgi:hypothetical protein
MPESASTLKHVVDHVIAKQHGGQSLLENLALCCGRCNLHKGPNIAGIDPLSGKLVRLFNPRQDRWNEHFKWDGPVVVGLTDIGRTTVVVLAINRGYRVGTRRALMELGLFPAQ